MTKRRITKRDKILLCLSAIILVTISVFLIAFWDAAYSVAGRLLNGVELVEDYIKSLGIPGIIAMMLIMIICFFIPVISSLPIQIACGISYGFLLGGGIVLLSFFIAVQLLYLFRQNLRMFSSPRHLQKKLELETMIKESNRSVYLALIIAYLLPGIPFLVISNLAASGLNYRKYTLATVLGMIPDIATTIFVGEKLLSSSPTASIITLIAIVVIITLSIIFNDKLVKMVFAPKNKKSNDQDTEKQNTEEE